ncbi:MAG: hypothetical protein IJF21_07895, partial [Clostridia bacterium]|nr:hypothetical protein [Clostridia bacterium]
MNISLIVTAALLGIAAIIVIVNVLMGVFRGLKKTVGSLIAIVFSALVAWLVTAIVCRPSSALVTSLMKLLIGMLPDSSLGDIFAIEELEQALAYYGVMIVAPLFFMVLFILISIIVSIVIAIVIKHIPPFKQPEKLVDRLGGAGVAVLCAFLVYLCVFSPLVGTIQTAGSVIEGTVDTESENASDMAAQITDATANNPAVNVMSKVGCGAVYNALSSTKFEGEKVCLKDEIDSLSAMVGSVMKLGGDMSQYDDTQKQALKDLVASVDESPIVKHALAGVLAEASERWLAGETFLGMDKFSAGELMDPLVDDLLKIIATTDKDTVGADLETMSDIFIVLIDSGILQDSEHQDMLSKLGADGVVADLLSAIAKNERMRPLADEITELSLKALATTLGIPQDADERYNMLMDDLADIISEDNGASAADKLAAVEADLGIAFEDYGVEISGEALSHVAEGMVADLGDVEGLTGDDVKEFFAIYVLAGADTSADSGKGGFTLLSDSESKVTFNEDGTISIDGVVLKNYTVEDYRKSAAYVLATSGVDIGGAATLDSAANMQSTFLTIEDIANSLGSYVDCEDTGVEADKVAEILSEVTKVFGDKDLSEIDYSELIADMGGVFDKMSESEIFGNASAQSLLTAVLQSDKLIENLGLSRKEMTEFAEQINAYAGSTQGSYASATGAVSGTVNAINSTANSNMTDEEKIAAAENMINNINKGNAAMINSMVTGSLVNNLGVSVDNSDVVSTSVQSLINNMA